jgi:hypothetical protein
MEPDEAPETVPGVPAGHLTALEVGALLWPDKSQPATTRERSNRTSDVRRWLRLRGIRNLPGVCGPSREDLFSAAEVAAALAGPRGRGRQVRAQGVDERAERARRGWETRRARSGESR